MTTTDRFSGVTGDLAYKAPCRVAAISNVTLAGLQTIEGVALADGDRVLVTAQSDATENGIYIVSSGFWRRSKDFDGHNDAVRGTQVYVSAIDMVYAIETADPITIGSTAIEFLFPALVPGAAQNFNSRLVLAASAVSAGVNIVRTGGFAAAGDGGHAWYVRAASEPAHAGKVQDARGAWWELDRYQVLSPKQVGAKFDWNGTTGTDDTAAHKAFATVLNAFGGGFVRWPRGKRSLVWPLASGAVPAGDTLYNLTSAIDGLIVDYMGAGLVSTAASFSGVALVWQFVSNAAKNIVLNGPRYEQLGYTTLSTTNGVNHIYGFGNVENIHVFNIYQVNGTGGVQFNRIAAGHPEWRAKRIHMIGGYLNNVGYGAAGAKSGDDFLIEGVTFDECDRAIFLYNVLGFRVDNVTIYEYGHIVSNILLKVEIDASEDTEAYNSITGRMKARFPSHQTTQHTSSYVTVQAVQEAGGTNGPGRINIALDLDIDQPTLAAVVTTGQIVNFQKVLAGGAADTTPRGHDVDLDVHIRASVNGQTVYGIQCALSDWTGEVVRLRFSGSMTGMAGLSALAIDGRGCARIVIEDFKTDGTLDLSNIPEGVMQAHQSVTASNFKSASGSDMVFASGKTWFRRLPDGMIEQGGLININAGASVNVTYPVPFRTARVPSVEIHHHAGANTDALTYDGTSSVTQLTIGRPGGAGTSAVQWRALGPAAA